MILSFSSNIEDVHSSCLKKGGEVAEKDPYHSHSDQLFHNAVLGCDVSLEINGYVQPQACKEVLSY